MARTRSTVLPERPPEGYLIDFKGVARVLGLEPSTLDNYLNTSPTTSPWHRDNFVKPHSVLGRTRVYWLPDVVAFCVELGREPRL